MRVIGHRKRFFCHSLLCKFGFDVQSATVLNQSGGFGLLFLSRAFDAGPSNYSESGKSDLFNHHKESVGAGVPSGGQVRGHYSAIFTSF